MALDLTVTYPGQVISGDPVYPYGKARNVVVANDGTGTPWEEQLVNDWLGFFQTLLKSASITPSGVPDRVGGSQYFQALRQEIRITTFTNGVTAGGTSFLSSLVASGSVQFLSTSRFVGVATFDADANVGGDLGVTGQSTFTGTVVVEGGIQVTGGGLAMLAGGGLLNVSDGAVVGTLLAATGELSVAGNSHLVSDLRVDGSGDFRGFCAFGDTVQHGDEVVLSSDGRVRYRYVAASVAAPGTKVLGIVADAGHDHVGDIFTIPNQGGLVGTYRLSNTGASAGNVIKCRIPTTSSAVRFHDDGGSLIFPQMTTGWVEFVHDGTDWVLLQKGSLS